MSRIRVRLLKTQGEFRQCERLQQIVWGTLGVSSEVMTVTQKYGGVVLGAFVGDRLAGFICAFLARRRDRLIHWSHMMAVAPEDRDRGLGFRMKLEHRRLALARGIKSICWTYDPLQSRNAALNVSRLGARVEEYVPDCYGHFPSRIEKGLASDRFVVNWRIALPVVAHRLKKAPPAPGSLLLPRVNETRLNAQGLLVNRKISWGVHEPRLLVEIPSNTDELRRRSIALARRWRTQARKIFERYFSSGYRVEDFRSVGQAAELRCYYILRRDRAKR